MNPNDTAGRFWILVGLLTLTSRIHTLEAAVAPDQEVAP
jgi:hypothetical protein